MVSVWIPIIAISVRIVVSIIWRIPDITGIIVIGIEVWFIGLPLIAVIGKWIVPPAPHTASIIIGGVSTTKNPTGWKPDLFFIMIRLR
jgi:hypothetical protein